MATARYYPAIYATHQTKAIESRHMGLLATGVAVLCAACVFFLLCERDHSFLRQASAYEMQTYAGQVISATPAVASAAPETVRATVETAPGYIPFDLTRTRHFENVGPISVGLWRTDSRHGLYDISVIVEGHRFDKKRVGLDEALAIKVGSAPPMELVVNRVGRNEVSGYLSTPPSQFTTR